MQLWRFAGLPNPSVDHTYTDVPDGVASEVALDWSDAYGLVNTAAFGRADKLDRAQAVQLLYRLRRFDDVPKRHFAYDAITWARRHVIATGFPEQQVQARRRRDPQPGPGVDLAGDGPAGHARTAQRPLHRRRRGGLVRRRPRLGRRRRLGRGPGRLRQRLRPRRCPQPGRRRGLGVAHRGQPGDGQRPRVQRRAARPRRRGGLGRRLRDRQRLRRRHLPAERPHHPGPVPAHAPPAGQPSRRVGGRPPDDRASSDRGRGPRLDLPGVGAHRVPHVAPVRRAEPARRRRSRAAGPGGRPAAGRPPDGPVLRGGPPPRARPSRRRAGRVLPLGRGRRRRPPG